MTRAPRTTGGAAAPALRCDDGPMAGGGVRRIAVATTAVGVLLLPLGACGGPGPAHTGATPASAGPVPRTEAGDPSAGRPTRIPGVGDRLRKRIPANSRQVVAVYGDGRNSADATVVLYARHGSGWDRVRGWPAHNGKKGWTTDHHERALPDPGFGRMPRPVTRDRAGSADRGTRRLLSRVVCGASQGA